MEEELEGLWPDAERRERALLRCLIATHRYVPPELEPLDTRLLQAASFGMDSTATADVLGIGAAKVGKRLERARRILGAKNTAHAVALALRQGIID